MMLHWILNPGLAINELILGQRVPKVSLEDKSVDKPELKEHLFLVLIAKHFTMEELGQQKTELLLKIGLGCIVKTVEISFLV